MMYKGVQLCSLTMFVNFKFRNKPTLVNVFFQFDARRLVLKS